VPEFKLWQTSYERPKLLVLLGRQRAPSLAVLEPLVLVEAGIKLRLQEREEEVEQVDAQTIGDDVPAPGEDYAEEEEDEEGAGCRPAVGDVGGRFVEVGLVYLEMSAAAPGIKAKSCLLA
jgi:hypothetical protein